MNKSGINTVESPIDSGKRYCQCYTVLGCKPCGTDISGYNKNSKYAVTCWFEVKAFRATKLNKTVKENVKQKKRAEARAKIDTAFKKYHEAHPETYDILRRWAKHYIDDNVTALSMRGLFYVLRLGGLKIPNNYSRPYRELIEQNEPDLRGFFTGGK